MDRPATETETRDAAALAERQEGMLLALSQLYASMHVIDLEGRTCTAVKPDERIVGRCDDGQSLQGAVNVILESLPSPRDVRAMSAFVDLSTLARRLQGVAVVTEVFQTGQHGWCKAMFVRMDDADPVRSVLYAVENIDGQMARLEEQRKLEEENRELHRRRQGALRVEGAQERRDGSAVPASRPAVEWASRKRFGKTIGRLQWTLKESPAETR